MIMCAIYLRKLLSSSVCVFSCLNFDVYVWWWWTGGGVGGGGGFGGGGGDDDEEEEEEEEDDDDGNVTYIVYRNRYKCVYVAGRLCSNL